MKLNIKWTDDCQGKKDYDGNLVEVSTRYWPGPIWVLNTADPEKGIHEISGGKPSARCSIKLSSGYKDHHSETSYLICADFEEDSFEKVAAKVEGWAQEQADRVRRALLAEFGK